MQENENVYEPDEEFSDEDFTAIDALIEELKSLPKTEKVSIPNLRRIEQMQYAYAMIRRVLAETNCNAVISVGRLQSDMNMGIIDVEGVSIDIIDMEGFARVAEFSSNMEVIPLKANKVRMSYAFYGLMTIIG